MGMLAMLRIGRSEDRIEAGFKRLGPWVTRFEHQGKSYGGAVSFKGDTRVACVERSFPKAKTILELGSLEGGQTFEMTKRPGIKVLGLEGRQFNIDKARYAQKVLGIKNAEFRLANLEEEHLSTFGQFDLVFCSGLLYHLPRPWVLLDRFRPAAPRVILSTHYCLDNQVTDEVEGVPGRWYDEFGHADPLSGLSPKSFWITIGSMTDRLKKSGYEHVNVINEMVNENGPHVILEAWSGDR